jgi:hypothetical protein
VVRTPLEVDLFEEERDGPGWEEGVVAWCTSRPAAERARSRGWRWTEQVEQEEGIEGLVERIRRRGPHEA